MKGVCLRQFRGFDEAKITIKPLTVLLGPNSAGKSTFGQALVALRQIEERGSGYPDLACRADEKIDLGTFADAAHGNADHFTISVELDVGPVELTFGPPYPGRPEGIPLRRILMPSGRTVGATTGAPSNSQLQASQTAASVAGHAEAQPTQSFTRELIRDSENHRLWRTDNGSLVSVTFEGLKIISVQRSDTLSVVAHPEVALLDLASTLKKLRFLGAERSPPRREYPRTALDWIGAAGEFVAGWIHVHKSDTALITHVPKVPGNREEARMMLQEPGWHFETGTVEGAVALWLRHLGIAYSVGTESISNGNLRMDALLGPRHRARALTDLGHGVSQALPVIVGALATPEEGTFVAEQPEGQLHPRAQAQLADLFCALVSQGRRALVETHSETFFRRLRVRAAIDPNLREKVAVYFIGRAEERCYSPVAIDLLDPAGLQWPEGFLSEALDEEIASLAIAGAGGSA